MDKLVITRWKEQLLTMGLSGGSVVSLELENHNPSILGNIYIGKVKNIVKNIQAAFVDIGNGQIGYFSLAEGWVCHADGREGAPVKVGDELIVQVERDAVKTKAPVLTGNLNFSGRYCVVTAGKKQIGFSNKITDTVWKKEIREKLEANPPGEYGMIIRTNAAAAPMDILLEELSRLQALCGRVISQGTHRTCYSLLYEAEPAYLGSIRDSFSDTLESILTDDIQVYEDMKSYLSARLPERLSALSFYQDNLLPIGKLYHVDKVMDEVLNKHVWLKSGGYLVIEPTEALTVIDVNTGKYAGKKNIHDTIMKINLEAAKEIGRQIRLRNLSGIILVDFIDMESKEDQRILTNTMTSVLSADCVKSVVVEITKLNLMEITRKKLRKPLHEQVQTFTNFSKTH